MTRRQLYTLIAVTVILSATFNVIFGRYITAKISTLPVLNRWKLLSPQAPIVINTREEVRVNDSEDIREAANNIRPKLSLVLSNTTGETVRVAGAVNLTSDGLFIAPKSNIDGLKLENLFIKLDDGTIASVVSKSSDSSSGLSILKADLNNVPVANLGNSRALLAGQRVIFVGATMTNFSPVFQASFVSKSQSADESVKDADLAVRTFGVQVSGVLSAGTAAVNTNAEVVGLSDGDRIISSDVIKDFATKYLNNGGVVSRPAYGFRYRLLSEAEAKITNTVAGIKIVFVLPGGPAQKAGLSEDDIILVWDKTNLADGVSLEEVLQSYKPGSVIRLKIVRNKTERDLTLTAGEFK